ncbi:MAG: TolC family protein [Deltaproteobacteria bacterium]|nr:TolC family protein [Deltaproteobacteria bacterium]
MARNVYVILLALFLPSLVFAGKEGLPLRLTMFDALRMARDEHLVSRIANERVAQAIARIGEARAGLLPQVEARAFQRRRTINLEAQGISIPGQDPIVGPFNTFDARIGIAQTLFDAQTLARLKAASVDRTTSLAEQEKIEQDAMVLVAKFFMDALRAQQILHVAEKRVERDDQRLRVAEEELRMGLRSENDMTRVRADCALSRAQRISAYAEFNERRLDVVAALGFSSEQPIDFVPPRATAFEKALRDANKDHPDLVAAEAALEAARAARTVEKYDWLPKLSAQADYGASGKSPSASSGTYAFGLQASMPIFKSGEQHFRIQEAESRVRESELRHGQVAREVDVKILQAHDILEKTKSMKTAIESEKNEAQKFQLLAVERHRMGVGTSLQVKDAELLLAEANDSVSEAEATLCLAYLNLARALGTLGEL